MNFEEKKLGKLTYLVKYPKGYTSDKKYPTIMFMHGAGTRASNTNALRGNIFFSATEKLERFPFIIIAPLCHTESWFDLFESVHALSDEVLAREDVDASRFYVVGNSMGGYATWQLIISRPEIYAAAVPVCGGGMYWDAGRLKRLPIWAFHGDIDNVVFTEESEKMVNKINSCGGNAKLTVYKDCGHDAWTATFSNQEVFDWMLKYRNDGGIVVEDGGFNDSKIYG